jgi:hypothetical protein
MHTDCKHGLTLTNDIELIFTLPLLAFRIHWIFGYFGVIERSSIEKQANLWDGYFQQLAFLYDTPGLFSI